MLYQRARTREERKKERIILCTMSAEAVPFRIGRIDHVALRVRDIRAAVQWYERVLGMEHRFKDHPDFGFAPAMLHTGDGTYLALVPHDEAPTTIESTEADVLADSDELRRRFAAMSRPFVHDHVAFNVTPRNYVRAREALPRIHNLQVWDADHGLQQSLYFRDLDGNVRSLLS